MSRRHLWVTNKMKPRSRYCSACGLSDVATPYTYLSPRNGYKRAWRHTWYKLARVVARGTNIPLPCDKARINPEVTA